MADSESHTQDLRVTKSAAGPSTVLSADGRLDATTYLMLRDTIIKAALDEPHAVIVDVNGLQVAQESAWAVFTSARWHVKRWPGVPILLVCAHGAGQNAIARNGIARSMSTFPTVEQACRALTSADSRPPRRRVRIELPAHLTSLRRSRAFVTKALTDWSMARWSAVAQVVVTTFVENVLEHTSGGAGVRLETDGNTVTVAVEDGSHTPASIGEWSRAFGRPTGLYIVSVLCRTWGNSPMPAGKTVWAVMGAENLL